MARIATIKQPDGPRIIEDLTVLADALQTAYKQPGFLVDIAESIIEDLENRSLVIEF